MSITFNHTIIACSDREKSAQFFREVLEAREAPSWGPFTNVTLDDGVLLQFAEPPPRAIAGGIQNIHYAFLVDDEAFDRMYGRLAERQIKHWADPQQRKPGQINHEHGGRGVYFLDPTGHYLEITTASYL